MERASLLSWLDELGVPHEVSIRELIARYGVARSRYYDWDVIEVAAALPLVPHQVGPLDFMTGIGAGPPDLLSPPTFQACARVDADARENHAAALEVLSARFGAPRDAGARNTIAHVWDFDTGSIGIRVFPPELQPRVPFRNPSHERHPELATMCSLEVRPGHVVATSEEELMWMREAVPLLPESVRAIALPGADILRGSVRRVPGDLRREDVFVGLSLDGAAIVGMEGALGFIVARRDLRSLRLTRLAPARGPGGARLELAYADAHASRRALRRRTIAETDARDGLDDIARAIEARLEARLELEDALDD
jgi:hypothetical protein